jgi:L-amino acid N-acyltransferase YncA
VTGGQVTVRAATPPDVPALAEIHVAGYADAYRDLVAPDVLEVRTVALRTRVWAERLAGERPRAFVLVAEQEGRVQGFTSGRPATREEDEDGDDGVGCWENLYLRPEILGSSDGLRVGLGLHEAAQEAFAALGFREAVGFVIEGNDRARRFFEMVGWTIDGHQRQVEGMTQHRMRRPAGARLARQTGAGR